MKLKCAFFLFYFNTNSKILHYLRQLTKEAEFDKQIKNEHSRIRKIKKKN